MIILCLANRSYSIRYCSHYSKRDCILSMVDNQPKTLFSASWDESIDRSDDWCDAEANKIYRYSLKILFICIKSSTWRCLQFCTSIKKAIIDFFPLLVLLSSLYKQISWTKYFFLLLFSFLKLPNKNLKVLPSFWRTSIDLIANRLHFDTTAIQLELTDRHI